MELLILIQKMNLLKEQIIKETGIGVKIPKLCIKNDLGDFSRFLDGLVCFASSFRLNSRFIRTDRIL